MRNALRSKPNFILATILSVVILCSAVAVFFNTSLVPQTVKLITITILLTFYYCQLNKMANVFLVVFLLFFVGDAFSVFDFGNTSVILAKSFYIGAYLLLIFVLLGKLKKIKFQGLVSYYLIFVLILNSFFLYQLYEVSKDNFIDDTNIVVYTFHGITLVALMYFAFVVYLSKETGQSITYLLMVFCFVFSDVLNYICNLYIHFWLFEVFERTLHILGLFMLYKYVYDYHTLTDEEQKMNLSEYFIHTTQQLRDINVESSIET
ncbi:hypothetical protein AB9K26_07875 [Psychroserpens sp. XS_ASV72]|uniref:hypothetical protein n=1 Tax=Psychroserpens sp. XS_ASV72 TaxID=3241293 RepID=UPI0035145CD4